MQGPDSQERVSVGPGAAIEALAHRYTLQRKLGQGGMAEVYQATDAITGREVAIKFLRTSIREEARGAIVALFEQEFHVLSELAHPRVVAALDYGLAGDTPYYTMELLDGGDLSELSPMPPARVCSVLRDVCSVLALLHSRRLVYRDLNARNVRCTASGDAKLIDFGAMAPMGPTRKVVGTMGFMAPEVLHQGVVDGRSDLYSVGAVMYYALTGQRPNPARTAEELEASLRSHLGLASGDGETKVPDALCELLAELLQPDPAFRPASAAEVIERLSAIGQLEDDDLLHVSGAYLITPPLSGRQEQLARVRTRLAALQSGRGGTLLFRSSAGGGRTRMLRASGVEAKISGALAASADVGDAATGDYGVADAIVAQLIEAHPHATTSLASRASVLGHALASVRRLYPDVELQSFQDAAHRRPAIQAALRAWLIELSTTHPLVLLVDDANRVDEPSLALLSLLADECARVPILLITSADTGIEGGHPATFAVLASRSTCCELRNLSRRDARSVLASIFGDSAQLSLLSDRIFTASQGNPAGIFQLAQFVVANDLVHYEGGRWLLPNKLDAEALPRDLDEATAHAVAALSPLSREVLLALSLAHRSPLSLAGCVGAVECSDRAAVMRALGDLVANDMLTVTGTRYGMSRRIWAQAAKHCAGAELLRRVHARLAATDEECAGRPLLRLHHLRCAGMEAEAVDETVAFCEASSALTDREPDAFHALVATLPSGWYELFDWAIRTATILGRPRRDVYAIRFRLAPLLALDPECSWEHSEELFRQLRYDVGLDLHEALASEGLEPKERFERALREARARFATSSDSVLEPLEALRPLVQMEVVTAGMVIMRMDHGLLDALPDLRPVEGLAPAIRVVRRMMDALQHRMSARSERAETVYREVLETLDGPDRGGASPTLAAFVRLGFVRGLAMLDVVYCREQALQRAAELTRDPLTAPNADMIRMLFCYFDSRPRSADAFKRKQVLSRIEASPMQWHEGSHLVVEVVAHHLARDAARLRDVLVEAEAYGSEFPGWQPMIAFARAALAVLRAQHLEAVQILDGILQHTRAGQHQLWCHLAGLHVTALTETGQVDKALSCGGRYLDQAHDAEQGTNELFVRIPLAAAHLHAGDATAAHHVFEAIETMLEDRVTGGLVLGTVCEVRAQIAIARDELETARDYIRTAEIALRAATNRMGRARCERLWRGLETVSGEHTHGWQAEVEALQAELRSKVLHEHGAEMALPDWQGALISLLVDEARAEGGGLFMCTPSSGAPTLAASVASVDAEVMERLAADHLAGYAELVTSSGVDEGETLETHTYAAPNELVHSHQVVAISHVDASVRQITAIAVLKGAKDAVADKLVAAISLLLSEAGCQSMSLPGLTESLSS